MRTTQAELQPIALDEESAIKEIKSYFAKSAKLMKYTMSTIEEIEETAMDGFFFWIMNKDTTLGLLIYKIDTTVESPKRIYLTH